MSTKMVLDGGIAVNGIKSPEDSAAIARNLVTAFQAFSSEHGFQVLAEIVDRIPKLEAEIMEKEKSLQKAREDFDNEKTKHDDKLRESLWLYANESERFKKETTDLMQRIQSLQEELSKKEEATGLLEEKVEELTAAGRKLKEHWEAKSNKLKRKEDELTEMTRKFEDSQAQNQKSAARFEASQKEISSLKQTLDETHQTNSQITKDLKAAYGQLEVFASFSAKLEATDPKKIAGEMDGVWKKATALVRQQFKDDIPDELLKRPWTALNATSKFPINSELPQSNSAIAKELRIIKVLGILAEIVDKYMLQPIPLVGDESPIKELLLKIGHTNPQKENFLRGMLLSVSQSQGDDAESRLVDSAIEEIMRKDGIEAIIYPDSCEEFIKQLQDLLTTAQKVWHAVQYNAYMLWSDFEHVRIDGCKWEMFPFQARNSSHTIPKDTDDDLMVLFPRVYLTVPNDEPRPLNRGAVISSNQIRTLAQEEREKTQSMGANHSRPRRAGRALSMSTDARGGLIKEAFLSRAATSSDRSKK